MPRPQCLCEVRTVGKSPAGGSALRSFTGKYPAGHPWENQSFPYGNSLMRFSNRASNIRIAEAAGAL